MQKKEYKNLTLLGKKNHYNIKLLRDYGVSINLKNNRIFLKNGQHDITGKSETEEYFVARMPYEKIVIQKDVEKLGKIGRYAYENLSIWFMILRFTTLAMFGLLLCVGT